MKNQIRILLNEAQFSQAVKMGRIIYSLSETSKIEFSLTSMDVREICQGKILMKKIEDYIFEVAMINLSKETIREILKRTPLYSSISEEII